MSEGSQTLLEIGSHVLSSLRGQSVPVVFAFGRLCVTGYLTSRGVKNHPMGLSDDGNDPAALTQTGSPRARVHGLAQDIVPLVVPGGAGIEAQFDLVGVRASSLAGPGKRRGERRGVRAKSLR